MLYAQRDLENKRTGVQLAKEQLTRTQAQVSAGRLAAVEAKAVEQSLAQRETDVSLAKNALLDTSLRLRTLMGQEFAGREALGVGASTDPVGFLDPEPIDVESGAIIAAARSEAGRGRRCSGPGPG